MDRLIDPRLGVGGLEDRLLVPGALTEDGIEPEADEQGDEGKDDDCGQVLVPKCLAANIMR